MRLSVCLVGLLGCVSVGYSQVTSRYSAAPGVPTTGTAAVGNTGMKISRAKPEVAIHYAPEGTDLSALPLFGPYTKTPAQLAEDQKFMDETMTSFKTRQEASQFFSKMAWEYLAEGNKTEATRRFNWAHLFDRSAIDAYWGLGVISYQSNAFDEAIDLMHKGLRAGALPNIPLKVDLATVYLKAYSQNATLENHWQTGMNLLTEAIAADSQFVGAYMQQALGYILRKEYSKGWEAFHKGYAVSAADVTTEILLELLANQPDPKGIFK